MNEDCIEEAVKQGERSDASHRGNSGDSPEPEVIFGGRMGCVAYARCV